tara:strand:+ start:63 stop:326 length:264 start_codon:yes stop_codon:yes gene_type:complete
VFDTDKYLELTEDEAIEVWETKGIPMGICNYCLKFFPMAHLSSLVEQRHITFQDEICVKCFEEKKEAGGYTKEQLKLWGGEEKCLKE